jgi:Zn finger protein HypA/HybF involved in hydrogenase expression
MAKKKKVIIKVKCEKCSNVFDIAIDIKPESEENKMSEVEVYCPFCDEMLTVDIKGKILSDATILRAMPKNETE